MKVHSYNSLNGVSTYPKKNNRVDNNAKFNINKDTQKDSVSFGAINAKYLTKSRNPDLIEMAKIAKKDIKDVLRQTLGWIVDNAEMNYESWDKINEIIKRKKDLPSPDRDSICIFKQKLNSFNTLQPQNISKANRIINNASDFLKKEGLVVSFFKIDTTPVINISTQLNHAQTVLLTFQDNDKLELFYKSIFINEELVIKDIKNIVDESIIDMARIHRTKKAIVVDREIDAIPNFAQEIFNLPNQDPKVIDGIKITAGDMGKKDQTIKDLKTILNTIVESAKSDNESKINYIKYLQKKESKWKSEK